MCFSSTAVFDEIVTLGQKCGAHAMMLNYPLLILQSNSNFTTLGPLLDPISKLRQRPTIPLSLSLSLSLSLLSLKVADSRTAHFLVLRSAAAALNLATCSNSFRYAQKIKGPLSILRSVVRYRSKSKVDLLKMSGEMTFSGLPMPPLLKCRKVVRTNWLWLRHSDTD